MFRITLREHLTARWLGKWGPRIESMYGPYSQWGCHSSQLCDPLPDR